MPASRIIITIVFACIVFAGRSQTTATDPAVNTSSQAAIITDDLPPGATAWEKTITNDKYVCAILDKFVYWDEFFDNSFSTTRSGRLNHATNRIDSLITVENSTDKYIFTKAGGEWLISNFVIKRTNISLAEVHVGQPAKAAFKLLGTKAPKEKITGPLYVQDKSGRQLIFVFADGNIVSMHY